MVGRRICKFHTNCHELQRQIDAQEKKVEVSFADEQSTAMEDLSYAKDMLGNYHDNIYGVKVLRTVEIVVLDPKFFLHMN